MVILQTPLLWTGLHYQKLHNWCNTWIRRDHQHGSELARFVERRNDYFLQTDHLAKSGLLCVLGCNLRLGRWHWEKWDVRQSADPPHHLIVRRGRGQLWEGGSLAAPCLLHHPPLSQCSNKQDWSAITYHPIEMDTLTTSGWKSYCIIVIIIRRGTDYDDANIFYLNIYS